MMRFDLAFAVMAIGSAAFAAEPIAVFTGHQDEILSSRIFEMDGCCFGVGGVVVAGKSKLAEEMSRKKAELSAQSDLLANQVLKSVKWPESWPQEKVAEARDFAKTHLNYSAHGTVRELQTLYSAIKDGKCISVVGAPVSKVNIMCNADCASIKKAMDDYEAEQSRLSVMTTAPSATTNMPSVESVSSAENALSPTNPPLTNVDVSLMVNTNQWPNGSQERFLPVDLGDGRKLLMDNSVNDDLLF